MPLRQPCALLLAASCCLVSLTRTEAAEPVVGGQLRIIPVEDPLAGPPTCPLKHTAVTADIAGFLGRVTVEQVFHNPLDRKIEAVYVFPLPAGAAVDRMTLTVGEHVVIGEVRERSEAREIYQQAKAAGHVAGLLDQERPNIFTQSVANIEPGAEVRIRISYVETLTYEDGRFEWVFPTVVGPRYIPGGYSATAPLTNGTDTDEVPDGSKITPPVTPPGTRCGHDISLTVRIAGGATLRALACPLHEVETVLAPDGESAVVTLAQAAEIPNRDFVLHYRLGDGEITDAFLVHTDERGTFFTLALLPPERVAPAEAVPRELVFVLDRSGSMTGFPIEKAKALMDQLIATMRPRDTFNVVTFSGRTAVLWGTPQPATERNVAAARAFVAQQQGGGGTEMMKAIEAALWQDEPTTPGAMRLVCFLTDGYVGNDLAIIGAVEKYASTTRVFSFGIGNSVNRFLLDGMARAGRGMAEYVLLEGDADAAVERFYERVQTPVLTDIEIDWGTLPASDVYPQRIPDLFSAQPILVHGRLTGPPAGSFTLRGQRGDGPFSETIAVQLPETPADRDALASLWARGKVEHLLSQDYEAAQEDDFPDELKQAIISLGVDYQLMTQFTSFIAVERLTITSDGAPLTVDVPVELPDGVSHAGVFGDFAGLSLQEFGEPGYPLGRRGWAIGGRARGARAAAPASQPPAAITPMFRLADEARSSATMDFNEEDVREQAAADPRRKLTTALRNIAERATTPPGANADATFTIDGVHVEAWRVKIIVTLRATDATTLARLEALGFELATTATTAKAVIGSVDARKLDELAKLDAVIQIRPLVQQ